jgi:tRNA 5-methylaminomethyl-2-thiouridine biosynthesis bifunctional protein
VAGTSCAERLAARGWAVTLIDRHAGPAREASGNPAGLLRPLLNLEDGANARLSRAALGYALRHLAMLAAESQGASWQASGVLQLARDSVQAARFERVIAAHGFPQEFARYVDAGEAARIAGRAVRGPGWWMAAAGWVAAESLCAANLALHGERIERRFSSKALRLARANGAWRLEGADGALIAEAPVVILANATDASALLPGTKLPLEGVRGQVSCLPHAPGRRLAVPVCGDGMVAPMPQGGFCVGATMQRDDPDPTVRAADHVENLARAESLLPGFTAGVDAAQLSGHAAFRATTPDRLPLVGALPDADGLHALLGLGARGLVWAPLGAELLAAELEREPLPLERELVSAVGAGRSGPLK